jgi:peptidylprolyl isomerase
VFNESRNELEAALLAQRKTHTLYLNAEDDSPAAKERFQQQRLRVRELLDQTFAKGLDVLRIGPDTEVATFLVTMIEHRLKTDIYDAETMEASARMIDAGSKLIFVFEAAARSAMVSGEFKMAENLYDALDLDAIKDVDRALRTNIEEHEQAFMAEHEILKREAEEDRLPRVAFRTTQGDVVVELFLDQAPSTVSHFIRLVEDEFYDDLDFHQVIDHLIAMTGDPSGVGSGNCGKYLMDEHDRPDARKAFRGSLVMAKIPIGEDGDFAAHSASSQFAILFLPLLSTSTHQTVFGRVIEGMDVISRLRRVDASKEKKKGEIVLPPDRIIEATVIRRPESLPEPEYVQATRR